MSGRVVSDGGGPAAYAAVEWIALQPEDTERTPPWPVGGWGVPDRQLRMTRSDAQGNFAFDEAPSANLSFGSVLIAVHRDHLPGGIDIGAGEWPRDPVIMLEPAVAVHVRVVDSVGQPQPRARVLHVGQARAHSLHERFLHDEALTDLDGLALLAPYPGEQAFWAEKGELVSVPWQGTQPSEVELVLGESFTIGGTLDVPDWSDWDPKYQGERRILVAGMTGNLWRPLARLRDVQPGSWGPIRVPLGEATHFRARLEGTPIVPIEETFARPPASIHRRIDFAAQRQADLWFKVADTSEQPIESARIQVWWGAQESNGAPCVFGATGADGIGYTASFPAGKVRYRVTAEGYAETTGNITVPSEGVLITLERGGRIVGTVSRAGAPVPNFQVIYWRNTDAKQPASQQFLDRPEGFFSLDHLAPGEVFLHAGSPSCPPGKPHIAKVSIDRDTRVDLELEAPIRGGGRVVAAETGEPVPEALVQPFSSGGVQRTFPWGPPVPVGFDGTFETDAFVPGINHITVEAPGFGSLEVKATATSKELLDWGDIRLVGAQTLRISLVEPGEAGEVRPSEIFVGTSEGHPVPEKAFSDSGIVEFSDFPAGDHTLNLTYPDGAWTHLQLRLEPGSDWHFDHKVSGNSVVRVHVKEINGHPLSPEPMVLLAGSEPESVLVTRMKFVSPEGLVTFEGVRAPQAQIVVYARDMTVLAMKDVFLESTVSEFDLIVGGEPLEIIVRDAGGEALPGVALTIRSSSGDDILAVGETGSGGTASLVGVPACQGQIDIRHGIAGWRFGIPIDASVRRQEFVLDAQSTLELRLKDGDVPLADVASRIETASGITLSHSRPSDVGGHIKYPPLGQGSYRIVCRRADCWTTSLERALDGQEDVALEVQMRRLADLDLTVFADGLPVTGVDVELRSVEFDTDVRAWIEQGSVRAPDGLTTGSTGSLRVEGLPRGVYAWTAQLGDRPQSGTFELLAAETGKTRIHLLR